MQDDFLTLQETAALLRVSTRTVFTWLRRGDLAGHKGGRGWRIRRSAIEQFLAERLGHKPALAKEGL